MYCIFAGKIRTNWNINAICSFSKPMSCKMNRNLRLHQLHLHEQRLISYVPAHIDTANLSNLCLVKCCETSPVIYVFFWTVRPVSSGNHLMVDGTTASVRPRSVTSFTLFSLKVKSSWLFAVENQRKMSWMANLWRFGQFETKKASWEIR